MGDDDGPEGATYQPNRLGVSIPTTRKLLHGNPVVAIGTYFEAATILGLALFEPDQDRFQTSRDRVGKIESLLPKRVVKRPESGRVL